MNGYIKLFRQIQSSDVWVDDEPFDRRSAWIDLLLMASHTDRNIFAGSNTISIGRGQIVTSIRKLADRWKWSNDKTLRFLNALVAEQMIVKESNGNRTVLTIENYDKFQGSDTEAERSPNAEPNDDRTLAERPNINNINNIHTNKNVKNVKERVSNDTPKKKFVPPTLDEVKAYAEQRKNEGKSSGDPVKYFDYYEAGNWKDKDGKQVVSWKQKFITWSDRDSKYGKHERKPEDDSGEYPSLYDQYWNLWNSDSS